jgi:hypothetical protein
MTLQRLIITFKSKEIVLHALYRTQDGPNPATKARAKEVTQLTRTGLEQALQALEAGAECVGTTGFTTREDVLLATATPDTAKRGKGA